MEMSGNSSCRRLQTDPIVSIRRAGAAPVSRTALMAFSPEVPCVDRSSQTVVRAKPARPGGDIASDVSSLEQGQAVLADLELVPVFELGLLDPLAIQEGAVAAPQILDLEAVVRAGEDRVLARDRHVVEEDLAVGRAPTRRPVAH